MTRAHENPDRVTPPIISRSTILAVVGILAALGVDTQISEDDAGALADAALIVLPLSLWLSPPEKNVNWVRGLGHPPRRRLPLPVHFAFVMLLYPLAIYLPTHWLLAWLFGS